MEETKPEALSDGYRRTCTLQRFIYLPVCGAGIEAVCGDGRVESAVVAG